MAKVALEVIATRAALRAAWKRVSKGKLAGPSAFRPGVDGESLDSFSRCLDARLAEISTAIRGGSYRFSSLKPFLVPKPNGKNRLICVPTVSDRVVQRAMLDFLTPRNGWIANGVSFGFVPDLGVPDAVKLAVTYRADAPWVFKTDITAFFDRIDRGLLIQRVRSKIKHRSLHALMESVASCEIHHEGDAMARKLKALDVRAGRGVRQGMPLSPFFANLMLEPFDRACKEKNLGAIRYADDLAFFTSSEDEARTVQQFCVQELTALRLDIPELGQNSKTRIYGPTESAEFLGVDLRAAAGGQFEVAVSSELMHQIKQRIYLYGNLSELQTRGLDITRFGNALRAAVAAYGATYSYCANAKDLKNHLASWEQEVMTRIIRELGIDVNALSSGQRWFLGLEEGAVHGASQRANGQAAPVQAGR